MQSVRIVPIMWGVIIIGFFAGDGLFNWLLSTRRRKGRKADYSGGASASGARCPVPAPAARVMAAGRSHVVPVALGLILVLLALGNWLLSRRTGDMDHDAARRSPTPRRWIRT